MLCAICNAVPCHSSQGLGALYMALITLRIEYLAEVQRSILTKLHKNIAAFHEQLTREHVKVAMSRRTPLFGGGNRLPQVWSFFLPA